MHPHSGLEPFFSKICSRIPGQESPYVTISISLSTHYLHIIYAVIYTLSTRYLPLWEDSIESRSDLCSLTCRTVTALSDHAEWTQEQGRNHPALPLCAAECKPFLRRAVAARLAPTTGSSASGLRLPRSGSTAATARGCSAIVCATSRGS